MRETIIFVLFFTMLCICVTGKTQTTDVSVKSLKQLISTNNEIECFAMFFDIRPSIIKKDIDKFRLKFAMELKKAGWNPTNLEKLIDFKIPFDKNGNIVTKEQWKKINHVDNDTEEKTLFHYDID